MTADIFDQATELEEKHREMAISLQRQKQAKGLSATHCRDCGEKIPNARQLAVPGVRLCIGCQTEQEEQEKRRR